MQASGLCHTDIHAAHGDWPVRPTPPFVPGHEGVGAVFKQRNSGYSVHGCYAKYFLAEAAFAAKIPAGVSPLEAAPLTCAGATTYQAVKVGNVRPTDLVAITGSAALATGAPQFARIFGGTVAAIDITDQRLQLPKELGADLAGVFALHAPGRTRVIYEARCLAEVNESIDDVIHGRAKARIVLVP